MIRAVCVCVYVGEDKTIVTTPERVCVVCVCVTGTARRYPQRRQLGAGSTDSAGAGGTRGARARRKLRVRRIARAPAGRRAPGAVDCGLCTHGVFDDWLVGKTIVLTHTHTHAHTHARTHSAAGVLTWVPGCWSCADCHRAHVRLLIQRLLGTITRL